MSDPLYRIPGGISMGSIAKMCHQHQAATNIIMASEIMGLAARAALDTKAVYDAVVNGSARSWMFGNRVPHMLANDWLTVHSAVTIILKDATIVTSHAKSHGIPLLLANAAEQLYITGTFSGLAKEDDAALVKLYLPKSEPNLVGDLVNSAGQGKSGVTIETILDILKGFHLASTKECMVFASKAGMDIDLLIDIITKGAGASGMYDEAVPQMIKAGQWSLSAVKDVNEIREKFEAGLKKAAELRAPMPMAQAALQHFNFDL
jgi:3-hydroxyisobutyrate dehydrogenase